MSGEPSRGKSAGRPLRMLNALMKGEQLDANTAAKRFGVQRAMALRDLQSLHTNIEGVVCDTDRKPHVFTFDRSKAFPAESIARKQPSLPTAVAASLGAAFSSIFAGTRYKNDLEKLRRDVVDGLGDRKVQFDAANRKFFLLCGREEVLADQAKVLDDVFRAILGQRIVDVHYQKFDGTEEQLQVRPYSLVIYDGHLYVVGVDVTGATPKAPHPYRFARIRRLSVGKASFSYPAPTEYDPNVLFRDSIGVWASDPPPCRVRVRLTAYWAVYAQHHRWHQSQQLSKHVDGSVVLELMVRPCPELEQWVLRFGENAEILEPLELRQKISKKLAGASHLYAAERELAAKPARRSTPSQKKSSRRKGRLD